MNDVKLLANAIRLELLTELRTARSPSVVENIAQRAEVLTLACSHRTCKTEHTAPRLNRYGECLCVEVAQ